MEQASTKFELIINLWLWSWPKLDFTWAQDVAVRPSTEAKECKGPKTEAKECKEVFTRPQH